MPSLDPILVDSQTARHLTGQKKTKFFEHLAAGRLVRVKDGRKLLVTMESIRAFVEQAARQTPAFDCPQSPSEKWLSDISRL